MIVDISVDVFSGGKVFLGWAVVRSFVVVWSSGF